MPNIGGARISTLLFWKPQEVLDTLTYSLNLTEANQAGADSDAAFPLAYSARNAYGLSDLSPGNWADLAWAMASDTDLFNEYLRSV